MRTLLDTNILIHREAATVVREDIGILFHWLDRLAYQKVIHPRSVDEIQKHDDPKIRRSFAIKLKSYEVLETPIPLSEDLAKLAQQTDVTENDANDTLLLNEVVSDRVDFLVTEDRGIAKKAVALGVSHRIFTIDEFLEKVTTENPQFKDYRVLAVRKVRFGDIEVRSEFFSGQETGGSLENRDPKKLTTSAGRVD